MDGLDIQSLIVKVLVLILVLQVSNLQQFFIHLLPERSEFSPEVFGTPLHDLVQHVVDQIEVKHTGIVHLGVAR